MTEHSERLGSPPYVIERRVVLVEAERDNPHQEWGVLNPAAARDRDGTLWLFPRLVGRQNRSVVGRARVVVDDGGDPASVGPVEVVLQPDESWERNSRTADVEDPRITWIASLSMWVMTYAAYGPLGPRVGIAVSDDLQTWRRLGPTNFTYDARLGADLNLYSNKDALWFPEPVTAPDGQRAYAMLHRPTWDLDEIGHLGYRAVPTGVDDPRPAIWVSFVSADQVERDLNTLVHLGQHREVAGSRYPWEHLKIGGGTPPIRTADGWLTIHHGVSGSYHQQLVRYCAGVMILDPIDVTTVRLRSPKPLLEPDHDAERSGIVPNVVFPTAIDERAGYADVFYGMAESRIGWARLRTSNTTPATTQTT